jgi:hypothetical protein
MQENYYQSIAPFSIWNIKLELLLNCGHRYWWRVGVPPTERKPALGCGWDCFWRSPWFGLPPVYRPFFLLQTFKIKKKKFKKELKKKKRKRLLS